jgi:putative two-component system response regulator
VPVPTVMIVEDDRGVRLMLSIFLTRHGYNCLMAESVERARALLADHPDVQLVLTDLQLPGESGIDLIEHLAREHPDVAVMMMTGFDDPTIAEAALNRGAYGYMIKPFKPTEVVVNVANALRRRALENENQDHRRRLQELVDEKTAELRVQDLERLQEELQLSREETIERLSLAAEFRDDDTAHHIQRMSRYSALICSNLGWEEGDSEGLRLASAMHDIGKIGIPDNILLKQGPLTPDEYGRMQQHCEIGFRILSGSESHLLVTAAASPAHITREWMGRVIREA